MRRYPVWTVRHPGDWDDLTRVLLANRALADEDVSDSPEILHDPLGLADMERAVERLLAALGTGERIVVFGDYDVDGVTSTALLADFFERVGGDVRTLLPHRLREGYGMRPAGVRRALALEPGLIVTADNGVSAFAGIEMAREAGVDVVVVDHHQPQDRLPAAVALVNPNRRDCGYPFKGLAAVGVAFKLVQALSDELLEPDERRRYLNDLLDLVALGTVADVAPMVGENRLLTRRGLAVLKRTTRPGLRALMQVAGVTGKPVDTTAVGFFLGPRLNSAGRLETAEIALGLLRATDAGAARELAVRLDGLNARRQELQEAGVAEAEEQVEREGLGDAPLLLVRGDDWHLGVVGLIASRLADRFQRPAAACTAARGDGTLTGSARSAGGYDLVAGIGRCGELLSEYGGHAAAAGFTLEAANFDELRRRLADDAGRHLGPDDLEPHLELDCVLQPQALTLETIAEIEALGPFGARNEAPRFLVPDCRIAATRAVGKTAAHLKLTLEAAGRRHDAIWWRHGDLLPELAPGDRVDVAGLLEGNRWNGRTRPQLVVDDLRPAGV